VIAGAVLGSAVGVAIPLLFHKDVLTDEDPVAKPGRPRGTLMLTVGSRF
jgi:hypothetical protein